MKRKKKYESIEFVRVSPDVLSRVQFDSTVGNLRDGQVNLQTKQGKRKLLVTAPATHAARLTNNNGLYQPRRMVNDIASFVQPFPKPVLVEHNSKADPLGRVVQATYEPIDHHFLQDAPEQLDEKDTFKLIKFLMTTGLIYNDNFPGVGSGLLTMEITDQEAIEKFLDQRYMTFSIRVASNEILDPHTGLPFRDPFAEDDEDDGKYSPYMPGEVVDGMPGFIVLDQLKYREVSPVNIPADETAIVRSMEEVIFADSENHKGRTDPVIVDGSYKIELISTENIQIGDVENMKLDKENLEHETQDSTSDDKTTQDQVTEPKESQTDEDLQFAHITDSSSADDIYKAMESILDEMIDSGEADKEAKLSAEQRKKMKGASFCGPNRSFPVPDSAHVTAARRLIDRAKLSGSQKQRVLACVDRKAKQLGCDEETKDNSMESFLDQLGNLSDFDFATVLDSVIGDCQERGMSAGDSEVFATFIDGADSKNFNAMSESKISELESQKKALQEQVDSLTNDLKNYAAVSNVLMKVFKDNLKISSIEDAVAQEKNTELDALKKSAEELLKDDKLIDKVKDYLGGFTKNEDSKDSDEEVQDPTLSTSHAKTDISDTWLEKQVRTRFESIKVENGLSAALQYVKSMSDSNYVSEEFTKELTSLNESEQKND
jgi:hypothetical protein